MITIALDEAGVFDAGKTKTAKDSGTSFIAGPVFNDRGDCFETINERIRIVGYYQAVIETVKKRCKEVSFPAWLHASEKVSGFGLKLAKEEVESSLGEFLRMGTYKHLAIKDPSTRKALKERKGYYLVCAEVRTSDGKKSMLTKTVDQFFRDDFASNIYFHMASDLVSHLLFHNPYASEEGENYALDIATRESADIDESFVDQYLQQGFEQPVYQKKSKHYNVMNADILRTLVLEQMTRSSEKVNLSHFCVKSMAQCYKEDGSYSEDAFLFLADSICGYLSRNIGTDDFPEVAKRAGQLGTEEMTPPVFAYDVADVLFEEAWEAMEAKNYYGALQKTYLLSVKQDTVSKYYAKHWIPKLLSNLRPRLKKAELAELVDRLSDSLMQSNLNQEEAVYIFRIIYDLTKLHEDKYILYRINDVGVALFCHLGDRYQSERYFRYCEQYVTEANFEDYVRTCNRLASSYNSSFDYDAAIAMAGRNIEALSAMTVALKNCYGKLSPDFGKIELAKTTSLAGQCYAYMKNTLAEKMFDIALENMESDSPNYYITLSYKIHYYIEMGMKDSYRQAMVTYTRGAKTVSDQFGYILEEGLKVNGLISLKYAFLVWTKGLYYFGSEAEKKEVWPALKTAEEGCRDYYFRGSPCEILYKYYALLALANGENDLADSYLCMISNCYRYHGQTLVDAIQYYSRTEVLLAMGKQEEAEKELDKLVRILKKNFSYWKDKTIPEGFADRLDVIEEKFGYMYS